MLITVSKMASELTTFEKTSGRRIVPFSGWKLSPNRSIKSAMYLEFALTPVLGWHPYEKIKLPMSYDETVSPLADA